jgi:uroporphyrinogen-III synthase
LRIIVETHGPVFPMSAFPVHHAGALAGATLIITRPTASALPLVRGALAYGAQVVRLPGISLRAAADPQAAEVALRQAHSADAWIFTSPAAVRFACALLGRLRLPRGLRVFAVGAGTARTLSHHGVTAIAPLGSQDSDGLLAVAELAEPEGQSIAIIDAPGGRDVLGPTLRKRGAQVERVPVYRRVPPRLTRQHFEALEHAALPWLTLLSSGEALVNLNEALPTDTLSRWRGQALIVSSERLAAQAQTLGFPDVHIARSALAGDLLATACDVLGRHRL